MNNKLSKHAYMIIDDGMHFDRLKRLVELLDDERNDIFIHLDKKSKKNNFKFECEFSSIYFVPNIKVYWGGYSLVACELILLENAVKQGPYQYYHLLSSQDLPLQTQDYIHEFFNSNEGKEFINFDNKKIADDKLVYERVSHFHIFSDVSFRRYNNKLGTFFAKSLRKLEMLIQRFMKVDLYNNKPIKYGSQWFSIDQELAEFVVANRAQIKQKYQHTILCDELFLQTLVYENSYFFNRLYKSQNGNLRYINWELGRPYTWTEKYFYLLEEANKAGFLFARKFDDSKDPVVVKKVIKNLCVRD